MPPKTDIFAGCDDVPAEFSIDKEYADRLKYNKMREDAQRVDEMRKKGLIDDEDDEEGRESDNDIVDTKDDSKFLDLLIKIKKKDPLLKKKDVKFFDSDDNENSEDEDESEEESKSKSKKKKMYLKDVQAKHLLEDGPDYVEEQIMSHDEKNEALKKAVRDAFEASDDDDDDDEDMLKEAEKKGNVESEEDEEIKKKANEYFDEEEEVDEKKKFLLDYVSKQLWKEESKKLRVEDEDFLIDDELSVEQQEDFENALYFGDEEKNAGDVVLGQSRVVEGSVRNVESSRKKQRKNKEERIKIAKDELQEKLKREKNLKKKEMEEKMTKVLAVAGFKEGEHCPLDGNDLTDDFDPDEYDMMMKNVFDDNYYRHEDSELDSDEDDDEGDGEKPDFDKEDEWLNLPKELDVSGDGFVSTREKVLKNKEIGDGLEEEEKEEGKRKRKKKISLVQRAKEALMEEYYKLDYEDTIGDLKTRFKYAKVQPNSFALDTSEILFLDDKELNQYVPLKKMAPYVEKDWEVNKHKVKEQKRKNMEVMQYIEKGEEKKRKKKRKERDVDEAKPKKKAVDKEEGEEKRSKKMRKERDVDEGKPKKKAVDEEEGEAEAGTSKLSKKAKRRRRLAEKKLPPNRMAAYGKTQ